MKYFLIVFSCLVLLFSAYAEEELIKVDNVIVTTSAKNAALAKEEAFNIAPIIAFKRLYPEKSSSFITSNKENINKAVREFEIVKEAISPARYRAVVNLAFSRTSLEKLNGVSKDYIDQDIAGQAVPTEEKVLILPLFRQYGIVHMWEDNPWLMAWQENATKAAERDYVVPLGDLEDMRDTRFNPLLAGSINFKNLMNKYHVKKILILLAEIKHDSRNREYKLSLYRKEVSIDNNSSYLNKFMEISQDNDYFFFAQTVNSVINTKFNKLFDFENLEIQANDLLEFEAYIFGNDYHKVQKILDAVEASPKMKACRIKSFSANYIEVEITTSATDLYEIKKILAAKSVDLSESRGKFVLR